MVMEKTMSTATYSAGFATALGGMLTLPNLAIIIGIITTLILFILSIALNKRRKEQVDREKEATELKVLQDKTFHEYRMKHVEKFIRKSDVIETDVKN